MAAAFVETLHDAMTQQVTFEATQLDDPPVASPRIVGRFYLNQYRMPAEASTPKCTRSPKRL